MWDYTISLIWKTSQTYKKNWDSFKYVISANHKLTVKGQFQVLSLEHKNFKKIIKSNIFISLWGQLRSLNQNHDLYLVGVGCLLHDYPIFSSHI